MCAVRRLRSACAFAQSDQRLSCPHEETFHRNFIIISCEEILSRKYIGHSNQCILSRYCYRVWADRIGFNVAYAWHSYKESESPRSYSDLGPGLQSFLRVKVYFNLTNVLLNPVIPLKKQCRSRSVGFFSALFVFMSSYKQSGLSNLTG